MVMPNRNADEAMGSHSRHPPLPNFPQLIAREKAHSLERFTRLLPRISNAKAWRSWGEVAAYSAKRMALLSDRADRPLERAGHRPMWFASARENVARIGHAAYQNPWKRTIDISIRRFREWWEAPYDNQLWMAVALIETSRLAKRKGEGKMITGGWNPCFTRNRARIRDPLVVCRERTNWTLSAIRNSTIRFAK